MNYLVLPSGSEVKESACNVGDTGDMNSVPGSGRYLGGGNGNQPQYSCLENSMDRGAWQATVHEMAKSQTPLSDLHFHFTLMTYQAARAVKPLLANAGDARDSGSIPGSERSPGERKGYPL